MKRIDIVVPAYDEEPCLRRFHAELCRAIDGLPYRFRVLFVDDGSRDGTPAVCAELAAADPRVGWLSLSRNFGHQTALTAGLDATDADAVITMDADLQHPPPELPRFIEAWEAGAEVVCGVRRRERVGVFKRLASRAFYRLLNRLSEVPIPEDAPDFRLLDARVVAAIRQFREQSRFLRGIYAWVGFRQARIEYDQPPRLAGRTKYDLVRMAGLALSAVLGFSRTPLRIATWLGLAVSLLSFAYGGYALAQRVVYQRALPGWTSIAVLLAFLSGLQLLTLGVIGEYLGQVLHESKRRPLYLVSRFHLPAVSDDDRASQRPATGLLRSDGGDRRLG